MYNLKMEKSLKKIICDISESIGERNLWSYDNLKKTADYIKNYLKERGYETKTLKYNVQGKECENLYAFKKGKIDKFIVMGAHYDSVFGSKGADDNASGVAVNLLVAENLKKESLNYGIIFCFFPNEEPPFFKTPLMGSYVFAGFLKEKKYKIEGMICFESVGYFSDGKNSQSYPPFIGFKYPDRGNFIGVVGNLKSKRFVERIAKGIKKYSNIPVEYLSVPPFLAPGVDFSDNWSFWKMGFKACMITDTAFYRNPNYHTSYDTFEKLDYKKMRELVLGISETLKNYD